MTDSLSWRDIYKDNPDYFDNEMQHPGYPAPVDVPAPLRRATGRHTDSRTGHDRACNYVLKHAKDAEIRLIHGTYRIGVEGDATDQAWVEIGNDIIFDGATSAFYRAEEFRNVLQATVSAVFSPMEAARRLLRTGHSGPWENAE